MASLDFEIISNVHWKCQGNEQKNMANNNPSPNTRFVGTGKGIKNNQKGFNVRFPEPYHSMLAEIPDRIEFIRQAVIEKLKDKPD
ncbi:MAG: hypothetical protein EAZ09_13310 [Oscillatoriales cyanobacterium]|nr:MAG: hypothetical protein EAZ18_12120 [Oscillatoriales cyanobacterium]TAH21071.1 MAG: hypothetical protein EAZ09_13310 [Oscillatoriales cyanobacterium]